MNHCQRRVCGLIWSSIWGLPLKHTTPSWLSSRLDWGLTRFFQSFTGGSTESDTIRCDLLLSTWTTAAVAAAQVTLEGRRNCHGVEWKWVWPSAACIISWQAALTPRQGKNWIMAALCFILLLPLSLSAKPNQLWRCRFPLISPCSPEHWWWALKNRTISTEPTTANNAKPKKKRLHWVRVTTGNHLDGRQGSNWQFFGAGERVGPHRRNPSWRAASNAGTYCWEDESLAVLDLSGLSFSTAQKKVQPILVPLTTRPHSLTKWVAELWNCEELFRLLGKFLVVNQ